MSTEGRGGAALAERAMEKVHQRWTCEHCHNDCVTVAWRAREPESLEPVAVRSRCAVCGHTSSRSFRPGTDPNTDETYTIEEWTKRGETERATRHLFDSEPPPPGEGSPPAEVSPAEMRQLESKARQCQPPHLASTWNLVPPVNEWYAADVPRLLGEVRRLGDENARLRARLATMAPETAPGSGTRPRR